MALKSDSKEWFWKDNNSINVYVHKLNISEHKMLNQISVTMYKHKVYDICNGWNFLISGQTQRL